MTEHRRTRGSRTGRPIMVLLDVLGRRWALRIIWELRSTSATFRELQERCNDVSPSSLNTRLGDLRDLGIVTSTADGYGLTASGCELLEALRPLDDWAKRRIR